MKTFYIYQGKKIAPGPTVTASAGGSHIILRPVEIKEDSIEYHHHLLEDIPENSEHILFLKLKGGNLLLKAGLNLDYLETNNYYKIEKWLD